MPCGIAGSTITPPPPDDKVNYKDVYWMLKYYGKKQTITTDNHPPFSPMHACRLGHHGYWSDYAGVDEFSGPYQNNTGSDGIGDTPYIIHGNNQDQYPLMKPWTLQNAISKLIKDVENMNLQQGIDNSLDAKLTAALDALEALNAEHRNDAVNKLYASMNEVEVQRRKNLLMNKQIT